MAKNICNTAYATVPTRYKYTGIVYWAKRERGAEIDQQMLVTPKKAR